MGWTYPDRANARLTTQEWREAHPAGEKVFLQERAQQAAGCSGGGVHGLQAELNYAPRLHRYSSALRR